MYLYFPFLPFHLPVPKLFHRQILAEFLVVLDFAVNIDFLKQAPLL